MLDEKLELKYRCKIKTLKKDGESMKVQEILRVSQTLTADDYLQTSGFPNRSRFREMIEIALSEANLPWFSKLDFRSVLFFKPTIIGPKSLTTSDRFRA